MSAASPRLLVVLRHCAEAPGSKPRPPWFDKQRALAGVLAEVPAADCVVVFDAASGPVPAYVAGCGAGRVVAGRLGCDRRSMLAATKVALDTPGLRDEDILYFVEDDYAHRPGWAGVLREAFEHDVADYVTLYDHPDKYDAAAYPGLQCRLTATPSAHWRTTPSTTNTWAVRAGRLRADLDVHARFLRGYGHHADHEKFVALREERGARLASCVPGWATHCHVPLLSPCVAWA